MNTIEKIKELFDKIFRKNKPKLLESGIEKTEENIKNTNEFKEMGSDIRFNSDMSAFLHKKGNNKKAIERLEGLLRNVTGLRNKIIESDQKEQYEEKEYEDKE